MIKKQNCFFLKKKLKGTSFLKSSFVNLKFKDCTIEKVNFWESYLPNSVFLNSTITNSIFTDADLSASVFKNTIIKNTNLTHAILKGVDFSSAKLFNINLRDAVYDRKTKWPKKFNPLNYGAIKNNSYNPFDYKIKLSYQAIKNLPQKIINKYKKKIQPKKKRLSSLENKIIYALTKGKGYIIIKNLFNQKKINYAEKIIHQRLKKIKEYNIISKTFEIDKRKKSINFFDVQNYGGIFVDMIQPKSVMNAFKILMGDNFICTYYAAQCSLAGSRGQSLHLDYPYVSHNKPGDKIPIGMGSKKFLLSCGTLTYINEYNKNNSGPIVLKNSHKLRKFPNIEDVKKKKFTQVKVPKGGILILNTLMWHAGIPNYTENNDRSLIVAHYTPEFVKRRMDIKKNTKIKIINKDKKNGGMLQQLLA
jgi:ectoine hydroxylase-related dioxygenase (phytanoyl-CoA dioxygenase family)